MLTETINFDEIVKYYLGEIPSGKIIIVYDDRETKSKVYELIQKINDENNENIENEELKEKLVLLPHRLTFGDYLISNEIGFERKADSDLASSFKRGSENTNLYEELLNLQTNVEKPIVIKEKRTKKEKQFLKTLFNGDINKKISYEKGIESNIFKIQSIMGIPVHITKDKEDTALTIYNWAKYIQERKLKNKSDKIPRSVPKTKTTSKRQEYNEQGKYNVGTNKAEILLTFYKNPLGINKAIMNTKILYTSTNKPKGIESIDPDSFHQPKLTSLCSQLTEHFMIGYSISRRVLCQFIYRDEQGAKVRLKVSLKLSLPNVDRRVSLVAGHDPGEGKFEDSGGSCASSPVPQGGTVVRSAALALDRRARGQPAPVHDHDR